MSPTQFPLCQCKPFSDDETEDTVQFATRADSGDGGEFNIEKVDWWDPR